MPSTIDDDPVLVLDGALWSRADAGDAACASPGAYLRAWRRAGAYTCGRTRGRQNGVSQWGAHVTRLRRSLAALASDAPGDFEGTKLPASDGEMEALVAPSVMLALSECAARGMEGPVDGAFDLEKTKNKKPKKQRELLFPNFAHRRDSPRKPTLRAPTPARPRLLESLHLFSLFPRPCPRANEAAVVSPTAPPSRALAHTP